MNFNFLVLKVVTTVLCAQSPSQKDMTSVE